MQYVARACAPLVSAGVRATVTGIRAVVQGRNGPALELCVCGGGASRSQSALHMHVLVCICSNVWQFHKIIGMIQMCYHTIVCS